MIDVFGWPGINAEENGISGEGCSPEIYVYIYVDDKCVYICRCKRVRE
jgi:hypothetical protein